MNENKALLQDILTEPLADHRTAIGNLLVKYPYMNALHMVQADLGARRGVFAHPLWDADHFLDVTPIEEKSEISITGNVTVPADPTTEAEESVSVYHDEHLPYSFLWWLNKTRMDHAHTYKPYAPLRGESQNKQHRLSRQTLDHKQHEILDQQIRESIFHLQDPEDKLSDQVAHPIPFQIPKKTDPVIDRFIQEEPKISPPRPEKLSFENKARKSASDRGTVVTETLAQIYEEQGLYPKALEAYEKLSLKFPEKSAYFADRIEDLKNKLT